MPYDFLIGKKLLILVGGPNLISIVKRAKELGVYTIVSDYYSVEDSPAKLMADEYWDISWSDIDALEIKCRENSVDGITTGYSETPVGCCIELCKRLGLPFYCTEQQLKLTKDKDLFKMTCRKNGVPVVNEYDSVDGVHSFPVIVKPVDRAGSIGVSIANDKEQLDKAYDYALDKSYSKHVIIEDFISNGSKFDVTYAVCNGEIRLLADCDTINAANNEHKHVVQSAWLFPSRYQEYFLKKADAPLQRMIMDLGIRDGYIFFSGFAIEKEGDVDFVFFETGFRLSGGHMYRYMIKRGIVNILDLFIIHALTGSTSHLEWHEEINPGLKCVMVNYYASDGVVSDIQGCEEIEKMVDCNFLLKIGRKGQKCDTEHAILSKMTMIHFCNHSVGQLAKDVELANEVFSVRDENNNDMVYDRIDPTIIANWWN